jgi:hypothetical protein
MKCFSLLIVYSLAVSATAPYNQRPFASNQSDYSVLIQMASNYNKKYIRDFSAEKKTNKTVWNTLPEQVNPAKGLYMIKLTAEAGIYCNHICIRKAYLDENSAAEVRSILPSNYYRIERPDQKTIELYFSKGANTFFAENPGFIIISGMKKADSCELPDLVIGSQSYGKLMAHRQKNTPIYHTASR